MTYDSLQLCESCVHRNSRQQGEIICNKTGEKITEDHTCPGYEKDFENAIQEVIHELHNVEASKGKRFANYLLDFLFFYITSFLVGLLLGLISNLTNLSISWLSGRNEILNYVYGILIIVSYYLFFEGIFAQTPGKMITRTKVVMNDGSKPPFSKILGRTPIRLIPFEAFSFLGSSGDGWHDILSKTRVVNLYRG